VLSRCKYVKKNQFVSSHKTQLIIIIIIIIIIFIQLQLGWNPVAEVYNTYTANV